MEKLIEERFLDEAFDEDEYSLSISASHSPEYTISDLIVELRRLKGLHGDLCVFSNDSYGRINPMSNISVVQRASNKKIVYIE